MCRGKQSGLTLVLVSSLQVCLRMKQYKDELLASCLTFALSLHHSMVALDIKAYCPALEVGISVQLAAPGDR